MSEIKKFQEIGIIGAGAWGTAMACLQIRNNCRVTLWAHEHETVTNINKYHHNSLFLPDIPLPPQLYATNDLSELAQRHLYLVLAVPSHVTQEIAKRLSTHINTQHRLLILTKGIESKSLMLMSEIYQRTITTNPTIAVLSGPNFAREIAEGMPAAAVLACEDSQIGKELQKLLSAPTFRIYLSSDLVGVQMGGSIKNILAIAAGICDGMGLGSNARAALICRGLAEMKRLGVLLGGKIETFLGLSGIGDLILTATDPLSRNYTLGLSLGKGMSFKEYLLGKAFVTEGVHNSISLYRLSVKHGIQMPICHAVYEILHKDLDCHEAFRQLLHRKLPDGE